MNVFYRDSNHVYRARPLDDFEWLVHGFGTREAAPPAGVATLKQIHSTTCVTAEGRSGVLGEGDALLENRSGCAVAVKTADCIPTLLVAACLRAVAAVHAGWRGTAAGIAAAAAEAMTRQFATRPEDLRAVVGPGIGPCCYEVGPEVAARFGINNGARAYLDLAEANRRQLREAGVAPEHIWVAGMCTRCLAGEFYSFRREGERAGRMYSFIGIR